MLSSRHFLKTAFNQRRSFMKCCSLLQSSEALNIPPADSPNAVFSPKIEGLVSDISKLTLLEVSELSTALKKKLNLPDAPMFAAGPMVAAAPVEEEDVPVKTVQTSFKIKLMKFDEKQKIALIKEVKNNLEGMNLVQAKKFVEGAPIIIKDDIPKDEAEKLKEVFEKVGAECEIS